MSEPSRVAPPEPSPDMPDYRPISGWSVAGAVIAGLLILWVAVILIASRFSGKPLVTSTVLIAAGVGWVTSTLALWQIRRSAGELGGTRLANAAWWACVLCGFGYAAFLVATELALRQQARDFTDEFLKLVRTGPLETAFARTLDPPVRDDLDETDVEGINARFGSGQLALFRVNEMIRAIARYSSATHFDYLGLKSWTETSNGYMVEQNYRVHNPEGRFDVVITAFGSDRASVGRSWQIVMSRSSMGEKQVTRFGRMNWEIYNETVRRINEWMQAMIDNLPRTVYALTRPESEQAALPMEPSIENYLKNGTVKIDGQPAAGEEGRRYARDMIRPGAINLSPGGGLGFVQPLVEIEGDQLLMRFEVEVTLSSSVTAPAYLVMEVTGDQMVAVMKKLRDGDWRNEPVIRMAALTAPKAIDEFPFSIRIREVDFRPNAPRLISPAARPGS